MKRKIAILFILTAISAFMAHMVIPHHEHGEMVCFENLVCDSEDGEAKESHACCFDQQEIIRSQNEDQDHSDCGHGTDCDVHFPPVMLFTGSFFNLETGSIKTDTPYLNLYTSVDITSANALRGPPQI